MVRAELCLDLIAVQWAADRPVIDRRVRHAVTEGFRRSVAEVLVATLDQVRTALTRCAAAVNRCGSSSRSTTAGDRASTLSNGTNVPAPELSELKHPRFSAVPIRGAALG